MTKYLIAILSIIIVLLIYSQFTTNYSFIIINNHKYFVELATTNSQIEQGLSGRKSLFPISGMLFIMPFNNNWSFWMKDMQFGLDFVWIKDDQIIDITENIYPEKNNTTSNLQTYKAITPTNKVLELIAGTVDKDGLKVGQKIRISSY